MTVLLQRTIRGVLGPKKSSMYDSEYTSGFSRPAASHLTAPSFAWLRRPCQTCS